MSDNPMYPAESVICICAHRVNRFGFPIRITNLECPAHAPMPKCDNCGEYIEFCGCDDPQSNGLATGGIVAKENPKEGT